MVRTVMRQITKALAIDPLSEDPSSDAEINIKDGFWIKVCAVRK